MPGISVRRIRKGTKEKPIKLTGDRFLIGRSKDCDIRLSSDASSRKHAVIRLEGDTWYAEDLDSSNGTFLNGKMIKSSALRPSDVLKLGEAGARIQVVGLDPAPQKTDASEEKTRYIRVAKGGQQRQTAAPAIIEPMYDQVEVPAAPPSAPPPAQAGAPPAEGKSGKMGKWRWILPLLGIAFGAVTAWQVWDKVFTGFPYPEVLAPLHQWVFDGIHRVAPDFLKENAELVGRGFCILYFLIWGLLLMRPWMMRFVILALLIAHGVAIGVMKILISAPAPMSAEYRRRIRAWTLYDWANSAFATVILVGVFPVFYAKVACAGLADEATASQYWNTATSVSLLIVALIAPVLGTVADVMRGKKLFLAVFLGIGVVFTGLLVLVGTGDWLLASIIFVFGRVGFAVANVFYDSLLPHVAREGDRDRVSTRGYAIGYLGGGVLLAANAVAIYFLRDPLGNWAFRLCFISVALWWALFSIPLLRRVPEPPAFPREAGSGKGPLRESFGRLIGTFKKIREFRQLFRFLIAFLIYNDGIGTISAAVIYGAELGFEVMELVLAVLLVQFAGIPFSLVFGRIATRGAGGRARCLAFVLFNIVALPAAGAAGARLGPAALQRLPVIFCALVVVQLAAVVFALGPGRRLLRGVAGRMNAKRSLLLALAAYGVIALWGFALDTVLEFWFLAFMIAVVQGGSQALSRSLYASLSPASKSGEFFGLFSVMAKFSAVLGPLFFVAAVALFGSSRPALLGVFLFFLVGRWILTRVDVEEGREVARRTDAALTPSAGTPG